MANTFGKTIPHYEDFLKMPKKSKDFFEALNSNKENIYYVEKFDGLYLELGIKETNAFFLRTKNFEFTEPEQINTDLLVFQDIKRLYQDLEAQTASVFKTIFGNVNITLHGEYIPCADHNIIEYDPFYIKEGIFVLFGVTTNGVLDQDIDTIKRFCYMFNSTAVKTRFIVVERHTLKTKESIKDLISLKSCLGAEKIEGVVVYKDDKPLFKVVDKTFFTAKLKEEWKYIAEVSKNFNEFKTKVKNDECLKDSLKVYQEEFDKIVDSFDLKELRERKRKETECYIQSQRNLIKKLYASLDDVGETKTRELFLSGYFLGPQNYRPNIGHAIEGTNSLFQKENCLPTIQMAFKQLGFNLYHTTDVWIVGNKDKALLSDIDIAISKEYLSQVIGCENEYDFWRNLETYLLQKNITFSINKGLKQFHILYNVYNDKEQKQPIIDPINKEYDKDSKNALIQIDFLIGEIKWMKYVLSGIHPESNSKYKAITRNLFVKALCEAKNITNEKYSMEYSLNFRDGLWVKFFDLHKPTGRQKNIQKEEVHKFLLTNDVCFVDNFLFATTEQDVCVDVFWSFEATFKQFLKYYNPSLQKKALLIFKELCGKNHIDFPQEAQEVLDTKKTIALFPGSFKPFHKGHYEIVKELLKESDEVKILMSLSDREDFKAGKAVSYMKKFIIPSLPKNVKVEYTDQPIRYAYKLAYENETKGYKTLMFVDKREYDISKSLARPFKYRTSDRLLECSGTALRAAIRSGDIKEMSKHLFDSESLKKSLKSQQIDFLIKD